jgi:hypothetical protein
MRYEYDDGGRAESGRKGKAGDCVVRAIAITTGKPYAEVYAVLAKGQQKVTGQRSARNGVNVKTKAFRDYMASLGFTWTATMRIGSGCTTHLTEGEVPMTGRHILKVSRHFVAIVDGVIRDTFDPSRGGDRCVYGYWSLKGKV